MVDYLGKHGTPIERADKIHISATFTSGVCVDHLKNLVAESSGTAHSPPLWPMWSCYEGPRLSTNRFCREVYGSHQTLPTLHTNNSNSNSDRGLKTYVKKSKFFEPPRS